MYTNFVGQTIAPGTVPLSGLSCTHNRIPLCIESRCCDSPVVWPTLRMAASAFGA